MRRIIAVFIVFIVCATTVFAGELRVVSLAPNITEILFALGLTKREVVAVTDYCDFPAAVKHILRVGNLATISVEKVVSLQPDYVFSMGNPASPLNERLTKAGLHCIVFTMEGLDEVYSSILNLGSLLHREEAARTLVSRMKAKVSAIQGKVSVIRDKKKVYLEIWNGPLTSCGKGSLLDEVIRRAGGVNITGQTKALYFTVSQEFVIDQDPDVVITAYASGATRAAADAIAARIGWQGITAVKTGAIITDIDPALILRAGPRIVDGIEALYTRMYGGN